MLHICGNSQRAVLRFLILFVFIFAVCGWLWIWYLFELIGECADICDHTERHRQGGNIGIDKHKVVFSGSWPHYSTAFWLTKILLSCQNTHFSQKPNRRQTFLPIPHYSSAKTHTFLNNPTASRHSRHFGAVMFRLYESCGGIMSE